MEVLEKGNEKLFSVIIPSYCHEEYIEDCLDSLKRQRNTRQIEVIVIDDCSKDNTYMKAKEWAAKYSSLFFDFVLLKNETNLGVVKTLNRGLNICKGNYIIRLASDDCLMDNAYDMVCSAFQKYTDVSMFCFNGVIGRDYSKRMDEEANVGSLYSKTTEFPDEKDIVKELYKEDFIGAPGCVISRSTYLDIGLYDEDSLIDDWEYYLHIVTSRRKIQLCKDNLVFVRYVDDSLCRSSDVRKRKMMNQGVIHVIDKYCNYVEPNIAKSVMKEKFNIILREVLDWKNEDEFLSYTRQMMKKNNIHMTFRSLIKTVIRKFVR